MLERGVPRLLERIEIKEDVMTGAKLNWNPFDANTEEDDMAGIGVRWVVTQQQKEIYDEKFFKLETTEGKASGGQVKHIMVQSGLGPQVLGKVWGLSDLDKDGWMNSEEFALCLFLLDEIKSGKTVPDQLPETYIPPSFRKKLTKPKNPFDINTLNGTTTNGENTSSTNNVSTNNVSTNNGSANNSKSTIEKPTNTTTEKSSATTSPPLLSTNPSKRNVDEPKKEPDTSDLKVESPNKDLNRDGNTADFSATNNFTNENEYQFGDYGAW